MIYYLQVYAVTFAVFFVIDLLWLGVVARDFYRKQLGSRMRNPVNWPAAIVFYLLFILGLLVFVLLPALDRSSWQYALGMGAFFGLITYATYDLTNLATLRDWPLPMTIVDLIWGTVLAASTALGSYAILQWLA